MPTSTDQMIVKASSVITMDPALPRAEAVLVDTTAGTIVQVGSLADCQAAAPSAEVKDLGDTVLMPGFIDAHSHPILSGLTTQAPAHWIAPYVGYPTYEDVKALFAKLEKETPAGQALLLTGLDRLLQGAPELTNTDLDAFFPDRPVFVLDNSGHEGYFNSTLIKKLGWPDGKPPADPVGARWGRNDDGTSNGRCYEVATTMTAVSPVIAELITNPLIPVAAAYRVMAENGITATTEHTFQTNLLEGYVAMASAPDCPLRISLYHMSIESSCGDPVTTPVPENMLKKQGIKLWADGSPWVGTLAASFPYLDSPVVKAAEIPLGPGGEANMNYTRAQLDAILAELAPKGWQFSFHCNGDVGFDVVLDAYERALNVNKLAGTDHRWRVEHLGAARADQFERAAAMGVEVSLGPFQFIYWGDLLDGQLFPSEIGSQWQRWGDAYRAGLNPSFHNDGSVSPPNVLLNIQSAITRQTPSGNVHGPEQIISLDDALKCQTINAAYMLHRDHEIGSIAVGKLADFVELSMDPYQADPTKLATEVKINGTWVGGKKIDLDAFQAQIAAIDPSPHKDLPHAGAHRHCC